jgi:hypothetical protein
VVLIVFIRQTQLNPLPQGAHIKISRRNLIQNLATFKKDLKPAALISWELLERTESEIPPQT